MSYVLEYAKDVKPNEEVIEDKGVKVIVDPAAIIYLLGTEMDYKEEKFSSQFVFKNPNETERCGCGRSFRFNHYNTFQLYRMRCVFNCIFLEILIQYKHQFGHL